MYDEAPSGDGGMFLHDKRSVSDQMSMVENKCRRLGIRDRATSEQVPKEAGLLEIIGNPIDLLLWGSMTGGDMSVL